MKTVLLLFSSLGLWTVVQPVPTVRDIIQNVPSDLNLETLLLPRFTEYTAETAPHGMPASYLEVNNREAKRCNETMLEMADKNYPFKVLLVDFAEIDHYREQGYRYFVDMALMPKQLTEAKKEVMVPTYRQYPSAQHMFTNDYVQLHYYFYIRDLNTQDAFVTTRLKGHAEVFEGVGKFLKQVTKDLQQ